MKMKMILSMLSTILLLTITTSEAAVNGLTTFHQCLLTHSQPQYPIPNAIFTPQNTSYSSVLQAYIRNLRFNTTSTPKPLFIITAEHQSHVQAAVICGKKHGLQMKIRSGGHDYDGLSYVSNFPFFILDMFNLRSIHVDAKSETAWVQTGAILGELYHEIGQKSATLGFPAAVCPTVGVGGHFSGGGYGNMLRKYGLTVDNTIDAIMVDVNGRLLNRKSMGEDLFWAIRGGGGASFGVVIAYKIKLVRVPETVTVFRVQKTLEQNVTNIVDSWQHIAHKLTEDLFIRVTLDVVNKSNSGDKTVNATFRAFFLGGSDRLLSVMNQSFPELGLVGSDCIETSWIKSVLFWADLSIDTSLDVLLNRTPPVLYFLKRKSDYVKKPIPKQGLEMIFKKMIELGTMRMIFNPYGGRMNEISSTETPNPHRAGNLWKIQYWRTWDETGSEAANRNIGSTRKLYDFMTPFVSKNPRQAFFNYRDADVGINRNIDRKLSYIEGRVYGVKYFVGNFDRLVKIKSVVDPDNYFRNEQSIPLLPY